MNATQLAIATLPSDWTAPRRLAAQVAMVGAGTALLAAASKIQVPLWPVPMTMQSYVVLVIGLAFGFRMATATLLLYLFEGALGLPVFAGTPAKGIGLAYITGPTGGYLVGFLVAAAVTGWLAERGWDRRITTAFIAAALGMALIFVFGFAWLSYLADASKAWTYGVQPFLVGGALKLLLAAATLPLAWKAVIRLGLRA